MFDLLDQAHRLAANPNLAFSILFLVLILGLVSARLPQFLLEQRCKLPPGPRPLPIIGNLLQIRKARRESNHGAVYLSSLIQYGEMTTLRMGNSTWVMLNSNRVVQEIIAKRASMTSERPYLPVASGLISRNKRSVLRQTKEWLAGRRLMHHMLSGTALKEYGKLQDVESIQLLANYLQQPGQWYMHNYRYAYSIIHKIVVGKRPQHTQQQLENFQRVSIEFVRSINASPVDFFPLLAKLPKLLQPGRRRWEIMGQDHYNVFKSWWAPIKQDVAEGKASPSFVADVLLEDSKFSDNDEEAMYLATSIVAAGSDNVRMTMNGFLMAALCYPEVMQRARDQIDNICGRNAERLPCLEDMERLPYISAIIKEGLRWRPTVPVTPQHRLTQDLEFEGYRFPAGTDFVVNSLAVCADCEEPTLFKPERWLNDKADNIIHGLWQFGGGRRVCVGYRIAHQELFFAYSRLIYCFDLTANGPYHSHQLQHAAADEPFPVKVTVRSQAHRDLITRLVRDSKV